MELLGETDLQRQLAQNDDGVENNGGSDGRQAQQRQRQAAANEIMMDPRPLPVFRTIIDFLLIFGWFAMEKILKQVGPAQKGFFCNDQSIRYPYKSSTVSPKMLFVYALFLPAIVIMIVEALRLLISNALSKHYCTCYEQGRGRVGQFFIRFATFYGYSLLNFSLVASLTVVTKYSVGRLRPHFIAVCRPTNYDVNTCAGIQYTYITDVKCDWLDPRLTNEVYLSFFSGHSALSMCAALYSVLYIQYRARPLLRAYSSPVALALIQIILISTALFIGYSRIFDFWHHWSDVLCGMIVATAVTIVTTVYVAHFEFSMDAHTLTTKQQQSNGRAPKISDVNNNNNTIFI